MKVKWKLQFKKINFNEIGLEMEFTFDSKGKKLGKNKKNVALYFHKKKDL
jgi:hypothetical protein